MKAPPKLFSKGKTGAAEVGSTTPITAGIVALALVAALVVSGLGHGLSEKSRNQTAADLAALGGAPYCTLQQWVPAQPCERAQQVTKANAAQLASCFCSGPDIVVRTQLRVRIWGVPFTLSTTSRAGPIAFPPAAG